MLSSFKLTRSFTPKITHQISRGYATKIAVKSKKNVAKDLANDNTGKHTDIVTETCILAECEKQKCPKLCNTQDKTKIDGHNTHKPPVGRLVKFVSETDAKGDSKPQYYVPTNKKVEITASERTKYGSKIKADPVQQKFIEDHKDKYE